MPVADPPLLRGLLKIADAPLEDRLEDLNLDQLGDLFRERWEGFEHLGHKTHTAAYDLGLLLEAVRRQCPRGGWLEWVDTEAKIARRTAQRYIKFRELVGERARLDELDGSWGVVEAIAFLTPEMKAGDEQDRPVFPVATPRDITIEQLDARRLSEQQVRRWHNVGDLVVTSWPYGLGVTERGYVDYGDHTRWELDAGLWIQTLREVLHPNGRVCLNLPFDTRLGGTPFPIAAVAIRLFQQSGFRYRQHHVWPKSRGGQTSRSNARGSASPPVPTPNAPAAITGAEEILVFHLGEWSLGRAGELSDLADDEALRFTNAYWDDIPGENDDEYPCVFPDELAERLIKLYSFPMQGPDASLRSVVIDFHCGRGTVARAAMKLGRGFVGGDLNPYAVALAQRNVRAAHDEVSRKGPN